MHLSITFATAGRVLRQLSHDHRTLGLLFVVPCVLLGLLAWMYSGNPRVFDAFGAPFLGIFPFIVMFLVTSIATLRERSSGTLERLLTLPVAKLDILLGYALAFGLLAIVQAAIASTLAVYVFGLDVAGPQWLLVVVALADALLGTALGLLTSAFARTEFQAVQFMPAFIFPQLLLGGLVVPLTQLPGVLEAIARCLPLTYAIDAMQLLTTHASPNGTLYRDIAVVCGFAVAAVLLGAATLRRKS
jgi:ABC-2 type transport system permease protein